MILSIYPFSDLDPKCMVGRVFMGSFPHFKSIEAYDSMASIDSRSMDSRIYIGDHKVRKRAKIRNRYNQAPHQTQDTNGKVTTSQLDISMVTKRSALSQQVTIRHQ